MAKNFLPKQTKNGTLEKIRQAFSLKMNPHDQDISIPHYMRTAFFRPIDVAKRIVEQLNEAKFEFDSIAVMGTSGVIVGPIVAQLMEKNLIIVYKNGCPNHTGRNASFDSIPERFIIIDDLVFGQSSIPWFSQKECRVNERAIMLYMTAEILEHSED